MEPLKELVFNPLAGGVHKKGHNFKSAASGTSIFFFINHMEVSIISVINSFVNSGVRPKRRPQVMWSD